VCFDNLLYDFEYVQINPILAVGHVDCHTIYRYFDCHLGLFNDPADKKVRESHSGTSKVSEWLSFYF